MFSVLREQRTSGDSTQELGLVLGTSPGCVPGVHLWDNPALPRLSKCVMGLESGSEDRSLTDGKHPVMTVEDITMLAGVYFTGAVIISLLAAFRWDLRLKARLPTNRPYMWGFFFGCICLLACFPLAAVSALEVVRAASRARWPACQIHGIYTLVFGLNAACGWFITRRKGWAWVLGTLLGPICAFPVLRDLLGPGLAHLGFLGYSIWLVNYAYGRSRWTAFHQLASATAPAASKPLKLEVPVYSPVLPAWPCGQPNGDIGQKAPAAAALVLVD